MLLPLRWGSRIKADNSPLGSEGGEGFVRLKSKKNFKSIIMNWDIEWPQLIWVNERMIHNRLKP